MKTKDFTTAFTVDQSPEEVFAAINNVRGWWSGDRELKAAPTNSGMSSRIVTRPHHYSKQKVTELIPGKKVVWLVLDSQLNFVKDKSEWKGTDNYF